jgi:hypothetical protein
MARAFQKKVRSRELRPGDMVLKILHHPDKRGKFRPNWQGPYLIKKLYSGGAAILQTMDEEELADPINICHLKKFYQ